MSGSQSSPSGNKSRHIQAAHDWLRRAEEQFASGQDFLAASNLMLAQAEIKLLVEGVATTSVVENITKSRANPIFLLPVRRALIGATALAACFIFGLLAGNFFGLSNVSAPDPSQTSAPIRISQVSEPQDVEIQLHPISKTDEDLPLIHHEEPLPVSDTSDSESAVNSRQTSANISRPRATSSPMPSAEPVNINPSIEPASSMPSTEPSPVSSPAPEHSAFEANETITELSVAEVALRTIQALSERLLMEERER